MIVFLLDLLSLEIYSETFSEYLPSLFLHIITSVTEHCDAINAYQMNASTKLCLKILSKIRSPLPTSQSDLISHVNGFGVFQNPDQRMIMPEPGKVVQLIKSINSCSSSSEEAAQEDNGADVEAVFSNEDEIHPASSDTTVPENNEQIDSSEEQSQKELTTMEKCLRDYKKFYVTFVHIVRLKLGDTKSISNLFELLVVKSSETAAEDRIRVLEVLLRKILRDYKVLLNPQLETVLCECDRNNTDTSECLFANYHTKDKVGDEWKDAVHHASKLLIELSTFETSVPSNVKLDGKNFAFKFYSIITARLIYSLCICRYYFEKHK